MNSTPPLTQNNTCIFSCFSKNIHAIGVIANLVVIVAVAILITYFPFKSLEFIVSCSVGGVGLLSLTGLAISSVCYNLRKIKEVDDVIIDFTPLTSNEEQVKPQPDALHPSHAYTRPISRRLSKDGGSLETTSSQSSVNKPSSLLARALKTIARPLSTLLNSSGGSLQQRTHYHLLAGLLDPFFTFHDIPVIPFEPINQKIENLLFQFNNKFDKKFEYFVNENACKNELQIKFYSLFQTLIQVAWTDVDYCALRSQFFTHLNAAWKSNEYQDHITEYFLLDLETAKKKYPEIAFLQLIGYSIFTGSLSHYADKAVFAVLESNKNTSRKSVSTKEPISLANIIKSDRKAIEEANETLRGGKTFSKRTQAESQFNVNFNPLERNNFASEYWRVRYQKEEKMIISKCLRFGTPTSEESNNPEIIPQMRLFLDYCVSHGYTIGSFQLQNPKPKSQLRGNESRRLGKMLELAKMPQYKGVFYFFGFPVDDYFNSYDFSSICFKKEFYNRLINADGKSLVKIPFEDLPAENFPTIKQDFATLIGTIHKLFFQDKKMFGKRNYSNKAVDERDIFRILTYAYLMEYFDVGLELDFFHAQCKDAKDRAIVLLAILYYLSLIRLRKEKDPEEVRKLRVIIEFATLIIAGDPVSAKRFPLLEATVDLLDSLSDEQKEAIRKTPIKIGKTGAKLLDMRVDEIPAQTLLKLPSEMLTKEDYWKTVEEISLKKEMMEFSIFDFVQTYCSTDKYDEKQVLPTNQFEIDFPRLLHFYENQKPVITGFKEEIIKITKNYLKEISAINLTQESLADQIIQLERNFEDKRCFAMKLQQKFASLPSFATSIVNSYHALCKKIMIQKVSDWTANEPAAINKVLALSHQGVLKDVSAFVEKIYKYTAQNMSEKKIPAVCQRTIENDQSNTCFNYVKENGNRMIQVFQMFEIIEVESKAQPCYYIPTATKINLENGTAKIICFPPRKENVASLPEFIKSYNQSKSS